MLPVRKFLVKTGNTSYYCKVTPNKNYDSTVRATVSFCGKDQSCVMISLRDITKNIGYIHKIDYNQSCVKDGSLLQNKGLFEHINTCLYTFSKHFPDITTLYVTDDSHIYCQEDTNECHLSLAHDYILKYNQTYYEKKYGAQLPADVYEKYKTSLQELDEPLVPYEYHIQILPQLESYKEIYESSSSPRNFLQTLREIYKDRYCYEVGPWLRKYLERTLHVTHYEKEWFINPQNITRPKNYTISTTTNSIHGGGTRKQRKPQNFTLAPYDDFEGSCLGYWPWVYEP